MAIAPDGAWVLTAGRLSERVDVAEVEIWDVVNGRCRCRLTGHTGAVIGAAATPDVRLVVTAGGEYSGLGQAYSRRGEVIVWDAASGEYLRQLRGHLEWVKGVFTTPDGARAVTWSLDRTLRVWDIATGEELCCFFCDASVTAWAVSADHRRIAVGDESGQMYVLEAERWSS